MTTMTLDDLKKQNEAEQQAAVVQAETTPKEEPATHEVDEDVEEGADAEEWMKSDEDDTAGEDEEGEEDQESNPDSNSTAASIRRATQLREAKKFQGRLDAEANKAKAEAERAAKLEAEVARLKAIAVQQEPMRPFPVRDDFATEEEYEIAKQEHAIAVVDARREAKARADEVAARNLEEKRRIEEAVTDHYARAAELAKKSGIKEEDYQSADKTVRGEIDLVMPGMGDAVTDALISRLGKGSEKVMYSLGRNRERRATLSSLLKSDPSGISAAMWLGELKRTLSNPAPITSKSPEPMPNVHQGKPHVSVGDKLKKQWEAAQAKGDVQKAWDIKVQAKAQKVNVAAW
jgi:hypothetical protein